MVNVDYALSPHSIDGQMTSKILANYSSEVQLNQDEVLMDTSIMSVNSRHPTNRVSQKSRSQFKGQQRGFGRIHHNNSSEVASFIADSIMDAQSRFEMSR